MSHIPEHFALQHHADQSISAAWKAFILSSAFQPIFRFDDGKLTVAAFEGLIRPFRDGEAVAPPAFFRSVPANEALHVETLTRTLHLLNAGNFLDPSTLVFVNFNPAVFVDRAITEHMLHDMRRTLNEAHIDPRRIVCEVAERKATSEHMLATFVSILRDHGFRIAVDDYGAEECDLERVAALQPDIVKFDAQWIVRLMDSRPSVALLRVMVEQFAERGIVVMFEGLEESWQLNVAKEVGAEMVQGFVLGRPELSPTSYAIFSGAEPSDVLGGSPADLFTSGSDDTRSSRRVSGSTRVFGRRGVR